MEGLKLNIGCGHNVIPGWKNIDNSPSVLLTRWPILKFTLFRAGLITRGQFENSWPKGIIWKDVSKKIPYPDDSVSKIYCSHFLEHLDRSQGKRFLCESFRALKKGGILRLVAPDLLFHARRYVNDMSKGESSGRGPHDEFLDTVCGAYLDKKRFGAAHRYMYDWPTIRLLLKDAGFSLVALQKFRAGVDPELNILDNRPEDSLHVDAVK
jgi:predicted SAM-dependent methyltransferase